MRAIESFIKRPPVLTYYTLVFAISWGGILVVAGPGGLNGIRRAQAGGSRDRRALDLQNQCCGKRSVEESNVMLRKTLLACVILSSLLYVAIDALSALGYPDYHSYV